MSGTVLLLQFILYNEWCTHGEHTRSEVGGLKFLSVKPSKCHWHPSKKKEHFHPCPRPMALELQTLSSMTAPRHTHGNFQATAEQLIFPPKIYSSIFCFYKLRQRHNKNPLNLAKKNNMKCDLKLGVIIVSTILKK